jgi:flagellar biosynthesis protein FlhG
MFNQHQDQAASLRRMMAPPEALLLTMVSVLNAERCTALICDLARTLSRQGSSTLVVHARPSQAQKLKYFAMDEDTIPALMDFAMGQVTGYKKSINSSDNLAVCRLLPAHKTAADYPQQAMHALNATFNQASKNAEIVMVNSVLSHQAPLPIAALNHSEIVIQMDQSAASITKAYQLIKSLHLSLGRRSFAVLICDADEASAKLAYKNIAKVARDYLQVELHFIGLIPQYTHAFQAAVQGKSVVDLFPGAAISLALNKLALKLGGMHAQPSGSLLSI